MNQSQPESTDQLLEELKRVGSDLGFRIWVRKYFKWFVGFLVLNFIISGLSVFAAVSILLIQDRECKRDNNFRKAYVDQWTPVIADNPLPDPPPDDAPQEVKDAYNRQKESTEAFVNGLNENFAQKDC